MVLDREQFKDWIRNNLPGQHSEDFVHSEHSPLWIPEQGMSGKCLHFAQIKPISFRARCFPDGRGNPKSVYWNWCNNVLDGEVRCFLSSDREDVEWWGFTNANDIPIWLLKWQT